jgi:toxin YoeB
MYALEYDKEALWDIALLKKSNKAAYAKLQQLLLELQLHPRIGTGHPEPLKYKERQLYSRRITKKHRLVYQIIDDKVIVLVLSVSGHYDDK